MRTSSGVKVNDWVTKINEAGFRPSEGWCHPHRFGSFAPIRGLTEDGSQAQWFIDGKAAFEAIASSIQEAKSEVHVIVNKSIYNFFWWTFISNPRWKLDADLHYWMVALPRALSETSFSLSFFFYAGHITRTKGQTRSSGTLFSH